MPSLPPIGYRIVETDTAPLPWGDAPRDWPLLLQPVGERVRQELDDAGLTEGVPGLLLPDDLLVNAGFVLAFLAAAADVPGDGPVVAAQGVSLAADRARGRSWFGDVPTPDGALRIPLILLRGPDDRSPLDIAADPETGIAIVDPDEQAREVPVPRVYAEPGKDGITFSGCANVALHLTHRTHLLQANLDMLGAEFAALGDRKASLALRYLWDRIRPGRVLLSRRGKGCRIHPTAIVEACRLGDNVEIGAYAIVRGCVIGDGAAIEDGAQAHLAVMGPRTRIARQTAIFLTLMMEGSHSAQSLIQTGVLGRHSATVSDCWFLDVRVAEVEEGPDGLLPGRSLPIMVEAGPGHPKEGGFVDSGSRLLGCTVGHETMVAAGVVVAPGRALPSRATIVGPDKYLLARTALVADDGEPMADGGGRIYQVTDGRLKRVTGA